MKMGRSTLNSKERAVRLSSSFRKCVSSLFKLHSILKAFDGFSVEINEKYIRKDLLLEDIKEMSKGSS